MINISILLKPNEKHHRLHEATCHMHLYHMIVKRNGELSHGDPTFENTCAIQFKLSYSLVLWKIPDKFQRKTCQYHLNQVCLVWEVFPFPCNSGDCLNCFSLPVLSISWNLVAFSCSPVNSYFTPWNSIWHFLVSLYIKICRSFYLFDIYLHGFF